MLKWMEERKQHFPDVDDGKPHPQATLAVAQAFQDDTIALCVGKKAIERFSECIEEAHEGICIRVSIKDATMTEFSTTFDALGATFDPVKGKFWPSKKNIDRFTTTVGELERRMAGGAANEDHRNAGVHPTLRALRVTQH